MFRYGSVPYLNAKPLLEGLEAEVGRVRLEPPATLARLLRDGELDVALAPVVIGFDTPRLEIVPAGVIATHGPVGSVLLFSHVPPAEARVVRLDRASRTSAALARVLYRFRWRRRPHFVEGAHDPDLRLLRDAEAHLLIGDPALRVRWDGPPPTDLGAEWVEWAGLPFVFAAWLARGPDAAREALGPLERAASRGRENLSRIAAEGAARLAIPPDVAERYLRRHLSYGLGRAEWEGLERFRALWARL